MNLINNFKRNKMIKTIKNRNVITYGWTDFLKDYPLVSAKLINDRGDELKSFIHPSTKIKVYFNSSNITFYLIGVSGNDEKIPNNIIYNSWDEVSFEELGELMK